MSERYEKARAIAEAAANRWDKFDDTAGVQWLADQIHQAIAAAPSPPAPLSEQGGADRVDVGELREAIRSRLSDCSTVDWYEISTAGIDNLAMLAAQVAIASLAPALQAPTETIPVFQPKIETCPKCGSQGVAFICDVEGCPVNGGAAYPWTQYPETAPAPDLAQARAVLEGPQSTPSQPEMTLEEAREVLDDIDIDLHRTPEACLALYRQVARRIQDDGDAEDLEDRAVLSESAARIEAALATVKAHQDQAGEVRS